MCRLVFIFEYSFYFFTFLLFYLYQIPSSI